MSKYYGSVYPSFWTGDTGRAIRKAGMETQIVALYLLSNGYKNSIGLYYLPKILISHETALSEQGASKGLQRGIQIGFCAYDIPSEFVFVKNMANFQIGPELKPGDKRVKWVNEIYQSLPNNPFLYEFYELYGEKYHIDKPRGIQGASKGHRSPIEEDTDTDTVTDTDTEVKDVPPPPKAAIAYPSWLDQELWQSFVSYRKQLPKSKFTPTAEKLCLRDLEKLISEHGIEYQQEIIEATIKSCKWLSFYPPRRNGNGTSKPTKLDKTMELFARRERERQEQEAAEEAGNRHDPATACQILPS